MKGKRETCVKQDKTYLLELLNGSLVDTTALVDQVTSLRIQSAQVFLSHRAPRYQIKAGCYSDQVYREELTVVDLPESTWLFGKVSAMRSTETRIKGSKRTPKIDELAYAVSGAEGHRRGLDLR